MKTYFPLIGPLGVMVLTLLVTEFRWLTFILQLLVVVGMIPLLRWSGRKSEDQKREIVAAIEALQRKQGTPGTDKR